MKVRALALLLACGGPQTATVEIVQPLPTATVTSSPPPPPVSTPSADDHETLDPRRTSPRSVALLTAEVQGLESRLAATPVNAVDHPTIRRRLAEDYVELRKAGVPEASRKAIEQYERIIYETPHHALIDEVFYYQALEYTVLGDLMNARRRYFDLISKAPGSRFVPYAYYAFGEVFLEEAHSDPSKYEPALQAYTKAATFTSSPIAAEAANKVKLITALRGGTP